MATTDSKTLGIKGTAINGLVDFLGAKRQVHTIGRPDLARFYQHLRDGGNSTPAIYNKHAYLGGKSSFFDWAINSGHYPAGDNPAKGHVRYTEKENRQRKKHGFKAYDRQAATLDIATWQEVSNKRKALLETCRLEQRTARACSAKPGGPG